MTQFYAYPYECDSLSAVTDVRSNRSKGTDFGASGPMATPSSVNWHKNCTNFGVSKILDWLTS